MSAELSQIPISKGPRGKKFDRSPEQTLTKDESQTKQVLNCPLGECTPDCPGCGGKGRAALESVIKGEVADSKELSKLVSFLPDGGKVVDLLLSGKPESKMLAEYLISTLDEIQKLKAGVEEGKFDASSPEFKKLMESHSIPNILLKSGFSLDEITNLGISTNKIDPELQKQAIENGGKLPESVIEKLNLNKPAAEVADTQGIQPPGTSPQPSQDASRPAAETGQQEIKLQYSQAEVSAQNSLELPVEPQRPQPVVEQQQQGRSADAPVQNTENSSKHVSQSVENLRPEPIRQEAHQPAQYLRQVENVALAQPATLQSQIAAGFNPTQQIHIQQSVPTNHNAITSPNRAPEQIRTVPESVIRQTAERRVEALYVARSEVREPVAIQRSVVTNSGALAERLASQQQASRAATDAEIRNRLHRTVVDNGNAVSRDSAARQLREINRELTRTVSKLSADTVNKIKEVNRHIAVRQTTQNVDPILRQRLIQQLVRIDPKLQTAARTDLKVLSRLNVQERMILDRLSQLQEKLKALAQMDKKLLEKLSPKEKMELREKDKALRERIDRLEKMLAQVRNQKSNLLERLQKVSASLEQMSSVRLRMMQEALALKNMLQLILRNGQINSIEFRTILNNRLVALLKDQNLIAKTNNSDLDVQRLKRLMTMQQMLREGQELSAAMMHEMLEMLSSMLEEDEGAAVVTRKGKRVVKTKKLKKPEQQGHGLEIEQQTLQQKQQARAAKAQAAAASGAKSSQVGQAKKGGPSGSLDVFQKEIGGKSNSYYEGENDEQEVPVLA